jgi:hypothetical protein
MQLLFCQKFVTFREVGIVIVQGLYNLISWHSFIYGGHSVWRWYDCFSGKSSHICARYNWLLCARFLLICSRTTQVKAVITCVLHKSDENDLITRLLGLKMKRLI